eukprot:GHRR01011623.1.p2 GENE.GHRR01011623.1~~GHRR01011623.1.p2  ORF type:complete len:129 (+),score=31.06 GHRR01011623.1:696-1082(+)
MAALMFKVNRLSHNSGRASEEEDAALAATTSIAHWLKRVHGFEVMVTRKAEGKTGKAFVGNMTEEKAVELASRIASESFLFMVGSLLIFLEYDRNRRKEIKKQHKEAAERQGIMERARHEREVGLTSS